MNQQIQSAILTIIFAVVSLVVALVLFTILQSSAQLTGTGYSLGGGIAGFATVFIALNYYKQNIPEQPKSVASSNAISLALLLVFRVSFQ
jgi:hypothetical protein